jgi:hypothetical protein
VVAVDTPRDRLETLFLRIVEEAQQQKVQTGGATAGTGVADFLRAEEPEGRRVIAELIDAGPPPPVPPAPAVPSPPPAAAPARDVLVELTEPPASPPAPAQEAAAGRARQAPEDVDRSVIDDLLGGEGR